MNTSLVYKSLIRLAFVAVLVSFQCIAWAANTAQSPAPKAASSPAPIKETNVLASAEELFKKGDYDKTSDLLWKNIDKLDRKGLMLLAVTHEKKKDPANMIKIANMMLSKNPKDHEAYYLLGSAQMMNKQVVSKKNSEAMESFKTCLEINPKYQPAYEKLAKMYEEKQNYYELRILYQDMLDNIGRKAEFLTKLCEINTKDRQEDQALSTCKEGIQKDPKIADNYVNLGLVQKDAGDVDEAKKSLKTAADAHSKSEFAQYTYANLMEEQKSYLEANKYYQRATAADEKSARSWIGYAKSAFELRKFEEALDAYKKACKLDQKNAVAFRKATTALKSAKDAGWTGPYEKASESCSGY
ncbi:tetratricopeptide repeat protein [Bdellovibrio sp. HCB337]|uniref:tetratricopeptide repeat protein n=1 Tax=Bdellovibrio sp. HCB337 TaxID=3394358 RepID=UPI0039A44141